MNVMPRGTPINSDLENEVKKFIIEQGPDGAERFEQLKAVNGEQLIRAAVVVVMSRWCEEATTDGKTDWVKFRDIYENRMEITVDILADAAMAVFESGEPFVYEASNLATVTKIGGNDA